MNTAAAYNELIARVRESALLDYLNGDGPLLFSKRMNR
jgi:hypothetical protein